MIAEVVTPRVGDGLSASTPFRPLLTDRYALRMEDVTATAIANQPTDPNLLVVRVEADADTIAAIDADPDFVILADEVNPRPFGERPNAAAFGLLRAELAQAGFGGIGNALGNGPQGRTWGEIAEAAAAICRNLPKARR